MTTWASVAGKDAPAPSAVPDATAAAQPSTAVVDANAIIAGLRLDCIAEQAVTIQEVLKEVRDKRSREYLEGLPIVLQCLEPTDESVRAVMAFARDSGELQSLSSVDMKLIALAHTLEMRAHGQANLRRRPPAPRVHSKGSVHARKLPGWGEEGPEWDALDQEGQGAAAEDSKISAEVQLLSLDDNGNVGSQASHADGVDDGAGVSGRRAGSDGEHDGSDDDGGWEVAAASSNAARRHRRKQAKRAARAAAGQAFSAQTSERSFGEGDLGPSSDDEEQQREDEGEHREQHEAAGAHSGSSGAGWHSEDASEEEHEEADAGPHDPHDSHEQQQQQEQEEEEREGGESGVVCVTADYAMQNVILQMGLRLCAPDGMRITRTRRWALRCTACSQVSKEAGRLFCGKCGNAALRKVEVVVGPDGAEQFGVRKKHMIRGTRYPLPKPKGGKNSRDPILREDVLLQRVPQMRAQRKEDADPFAPEYGAETWYQKSSALPAHVRAAAASLDNWKRNPNERRHVRTNRRK